jgi:hypothetical protein
MNKQQALALLQLIADLYQVVQAPDPATEPAAEPVQNNGREPVVVKT